MFCFSRKFLWVALAVMEPSLQIMLALNSLEFSLPPHAGIKGRGFTTQPSEHTKFKRELECGISQYKTLFT